VKYGGYNKSNFEMNFFPDIKIFSKEEDNILMILAHGLFINIVKHISGAKYKTCYPIEKVFCHQDKNSTLSTKQKSAFLMYYELIMLREEQKELKLNLVTKLPKGVTDEIKNRYKKYIEDCYKKINNVINKRINKTIKHGKKQGKKYGKKM
jgi:hypothetical protein